MRKVAAIALALATFLSTASCMTRQPEPQPSRFTASASDAAAPYADYLDSRLGESAAGVTVGTAEDAARFDVDLSTLRDDGYVIRKKDGDALILGKTETHHKSDSLHIYQ